MSGNIGWFSDQDIIKYIRMKIPNEYDHQPNSQYIKKIQKSGMRPSWRKRIVKWMFDAAEEFDMNNDTVSTAMNYLDRFLSVFSADSTLLQLSAMVCLYTASKIYESQPITMEEMDLLSEKKFTHKEIRDLEMKLLHTLKWSMTPVTFHTLARNLTCLLFTHNESKEKDEFTKDLSEYLSIALQEYGFLRYSPSTIAATVFIATSKKFNLEAMTWKLLNLFGINEQNEKFKRCMELLVTQIKNYTNIDVMATSHITVKADVTNQTTIAYSVDKNSMIIINTEKTNTIIQINIENSTQSKTYSPTSVDELNGITTSDNVGTVKRQRMD